MTTWALAAWCAAAPGACGAGDDATAGDASTGGTVVGDTSTGVDATMDPVVELVSAIMDPAIDPGAPQDQNTCIGAVVALVTPDGTHVLGYGATAAHGATRPDGDTLFQIGSISKVFTGLGLAALVASGELSADDLVTAHLESDLATPLSGSQISLAHLITHRAGFANMPSNLVDRDLDGLMDPDSDRLSPATGYARADLASYLDGFTPMSAPGAAYFYSNVGLGLLGVALADYLEVGGFDAVLGALVTDALGMTETWGKVGAIAPGAASRAAQGWAIDKGVRVLGHFGQMGVLASAGEIVTTGNDMLRLLAALTGTSSTSLDPAVEVALTPLAAGRGAQDIGYAIEIESLSDGTIYTKGGLTSSYSAFVAFRRDPRVGVIVMSSCGDFTRVRELSLAIVDGVVAQLR